MNSGKAIIEHIYSLIRGEVIPEVPAELAETPGIHELHDELCKVIEERRLLKKQVAEHEKMIDKLKDDLVFQETQSLAMQERETQLNFLADHDPLTGILNRRSFAKRAAAEIKNAAFHKTHCGIVMLDIDHFKIFNDTWGHQAGDEALRHVVDVISRQLRQHDFMGRYGGEEFFFFFTRAERSVALSIAERIRKAVAESPVMLEAGPVNIQASFGVAMASDVELSEETPIEEKLAKLIHYADIALYKAKESGRNRVVGYEKELEQTITPDVSPVSGS